MDKRKVLRTVPGTWQALQVNINVDAGVDEMETWLSIWYFFIIFLSNLKKISYLTLFLPKHLSLPL